MDDAVETVMLVRSILMLKVDTLDMASVLVWVPGVVQLVEVLHVRSKCRLCFAHESKSGFQP